MQTLTLDYDSGKALLYYMCYQNDIKYPKYMYEEDIAYYFFGERGRKLELCHDNWERQILSTCHEKFDCLYSLMTLYDQISLPPIFDTRAYLYDCDKAQLEEIGITYNTEKLSYPSDSIIKEVVSIMRSNKKEVCAYLDNDNAHRSWDYFSDDVFELYFKMEAYKSIFTDVPPDNTMRGVRPFPIGHDVGINNALNYLDAYFLSITNALLNPKSVFYSQLISISKMKKVDADSCKKLNKYFINTNFSKGLSIIPKAENYRDIVELRKDPNLQSFREVFGEWVDYFVKGDFASIGKIKQDVIKANENLCKLKKYERVTNSPIFNIISLLLGAMIPEVSYLLGSLGVVSAFYEPEIELKNRWVNLPAFHEDRTRYYRYDDNNK